ncbi:hypothetical protein ACJX0J_033870, partial [Zea mays]
KEFISNPIIFRRINEIDFLYLETVKSIIIMLYCNDSLTRLHGTAAIAMCPQMHGWMFLWICNNMVIMLLRPCFLLLMQAAKSEAAKSV